MTQEEKAKAYDEAIEKARECLKDGTITQVAIDYIETIFPELAESEDERIRKGLIKAVSGTLKGNTLFGTDVTREEALAWLEKQGDKDSQLKLPTFTFDDILALQCCMETVKKVQEDKELYEKLKDLHSRVYDAYHLEKQGEQKPQKALKWKHWENGIAGNGEGKDTFLIKWSPWHYSISSCLGSECDYIELSELDKLLDECVFGKSKKSGKVETKEVTGTLKEMLDNIDPMELEETRKEMMESMPTDEEVQKLHDHLEMHKELGGFKKPIEVNMDDLPDNPVDAFAKGVEKARSEMKSEQQTVTFIDSGTMQVIDKLNEIIGKLGDIHQVLSKPFVLPYRDYTPPQEPWYKTHGVEKVTPVTCETTNGFNKSEKRIEQ